MNAPLLSLVIPAYNEVESLPELAREIRELDVRIQRANWEIDLLD